MLFSAVFETVVDMIRHKHAGLANRLARHFKYLAAQRECLMSRVACIRP